LCTISGTITFGMALFSTLSLKFGYKLVMFQFTIIILFQTLSMLFLHDNKVAYLVIYVYDGLFKGGMLIIFFEATAELAYPIGESISLGFMLLIEKVLRFIFSCIHA
jgi:hypothetical protein